MLASWILVVIVLVLVILLLRVRHIKHRVTIFIIIFLVLTFYFTSVKVLSKENINYKSVEGVEKAIKIYVTWLGHAVKNLKSLTGDVTKINWWDIQNTTQITGTKPAK